MKEKQVELKVILLGNKAVGKTSILYAYTEGIFPEDYSTTWGVNLLQKEFQDEDDINANVVFWDITSSDLFQDQRPYYFEGAEAILLIYDLSDPESFSSLANWHSEVVTMPKMRNKPFFLIGNKSDLNQNVEKKAVEKFAFDIEARHFILSAKTGENLNKTFYEIIESLV